MTRRSIIQDCTSFNVYGNVQSGASTFSWDTSVSVFYLCPVNLLCRARALFGRIVLLVNIYTEALRTSGI